nr:helix-turn-helix domain-containing protein [Cellulosimicrobium sp. MM]
MPRTDARRSARDRLLDAAEALFVEHGIAATGVDAVLRRAEVSPATLYAHFPGKDHLVAAYLERRHERWRAAWDAELDPLQGRRGRARARRLRRARRLPHRDEHPRLRVPRRCGRGHRPRAPRVPVARRRHSAARRPAARPRRRDRRREPGRPRGRAPRALRRRARLPHAPRRRGRRRPDAPPVARPRSRGGRAPPRLNCPALLMRSPACAAILDAGPRHDTREAPWSPCRGTRRRPNRPRTTNPPSTRGPTPTGGARSSSWRSRCRWSSSTGRSSPSPSRRSSPT